jgi:hypothetical protein
LLKNEESSEVIFSAHLLEPTVVLSIQQKAGKFEVSPAVLIDHVPVDTTTQ